MSLTFRKGVYILNRILRSCELSEGNRFVFMENPREGMCQGKTHLVKFGITYSIMKHVKKHLTYETGSVAKRQRNGRP